MKNDVKILGNTIFIACDGREIYRPLNHIFYCESVCRTCEIKFNTGKIQLAYIGINKLEQMLPHDSFYKCNRFFIIYFGILKEASIEDGKIVFQDISLPVSRDRFSEFMHKAEAFLAANA
jgi:DNA-binding LytR/AlgR family response regulator